jgi:hypothetical protein
VQKKEKDRELPEEGFSLFMVLNFWTVHGLQVTSFLPTRIGDDSKKKGAPSF